MSGADIIFEGIEKQKKPADSLFSDKRFLRSTTRGLTAYIKERLPAMLYDVKIYRHRKARLKQ